MNDTVTMNADACVSKRYFCVDVLSFAIYVTIYTRAMRIGMDVSEEMGDVWDDVL